LKLLDLVNPRKIRRRLGLNQEEFWTRIGVTQSGGSRYESGRTMPKPVRQLLRLVHVERVDLSRVKKRTSRLIDHLKSNIRIFIRACARRRKQAQEVRGNPSTSPTSHSLGRRAGQKTQRQLRQGNEGG